MTLATTNKGGRPVTRKRLCRVRIRLCSNHCRACAGQHEFTEPMDATRIDPFHVRITQPDEKVWFGAVLCAKDFEFCESEVGDE